jgi:hypothetical protein
LSSITRAVKCLFLAIGHLLGSDAGLSASEMAGGTVIRCIWHHHRPALRLSLSCSQLHVQKRRYRSGR